MAPSKRRTLADELADLEDPTPKDFDPEDIERQDAASDSDSGASSADEGGEFTGREHYEEVGKSKLRKSDGPELGKDYAGSKISRQALMEDDEHDPFAAHSDSAEDDDDDVEEDEDDEEEEDGDASVDDDDGSLGSDLEAFEHDSEDGTDGDGEIDEDDSEEDDDDDDDSGDGDESEDTTDDDDDDEPATPKDTDAHDPRSELRRLMAQDAKAVASTISAAAKADAEKGRAVKRQRRGYDALVGVRMKMQKAFTGLNVLSELSSSSAEKAEQEGGEDTTGRTAILQQLSSEDLRGAETAALSLWSTMEELREALADAQTQKTSGASKRKRDALPPPDTSTPLQSLWDRMEAHEAAARPYRRAVLERWAAKTRGVKAALPSGRGKLMASATGTDQQGIGAVLDSYVAAEQQQQQQQGAGDATTAARPMPGYDDAQFYQSLLRTLVEERLAATSSTASAVSNLDNAAASAGSAGALLPTTAALSTLSLLPRTNVVGMRKDKVKRDVDTKASKGRKMRFNVHEELQNFMAPEDRGTWSEAAREEFFASLLGKSAAGVLGEGDDEEEGAQDEDMKGVDAEEAGLMLFRR
ncbi:rRNA-processing protein bfr2 [Ascosphaera acerosa]|nr:rRNA-processing protein bfr2 [Ascosphaera acerosa]